MFDLACGYKNEGMTAYSRLQQKEFRSEADFAYEGVKHQRFVGTGYFDAVQQVISGGTASTTALTGSTEEAQFRPTQKTQWRVEIPGIALDVEAADPRNSTHPVETVAHSLETLELMPSGD